jgi:PAS domain S-box-containing protein/diguanylate cyclase (GGDEF)-like protein
LSLGAGLGDTCQARVVGQQFMLALVNSDSPVPNASSDPFPGPLALGDLVSLLTNETQTGLFLVQHGRFRYVNAHLAELIGSSIDELIGSKAIDLVVPCDRPRVAEQVRLRLPGDAGKPYEIHCLRKDGTAFAAQVCGRRVEIDGHPGDLVTLHDISKRRALENELERKNAVLSTQQDTSLDAVLLVDEDSTIISYNRKFVEMWNLPEELVCLQSDPPLLQHVVAQVENPEAFLARINFLYANREERSREEIRTRDGRVLDRFTAPVVSTNGEYFGRVWYFRDITGPKRAEESLRRANRALLVISAVNRALISGEDESKLLNTVCKVILQLGGYAMAWIGFLEQDEGRSVRPVAQCGSEKGFLTGTRITWADTECGSTSTRDAARTGRVQVCRDIDSDPRMSTGRTETARLGYRSSIALPLAGNIGTLGVLTIYAPDTNAFDEDEVALLHELAANVSFGISTHRSNIEHTRAVARAERLARFDALTELPNRVLLLEDVGITIRSAKEKSEEFGLLSIDVPRIEEIKGNMGFGASDSLAMTIAARLQEICSDSELAARLEGSEFAVRLDPSTSRLGETVLARAQHIRTALRAPAMIGSTEVVPECAIGIVIFPSDGGDAATLLERAQTARNRAGIGQTGEISFYGKEKIGRAMRDLGLESALRHAIDLDEMELAYQPEVDLHTGQIVAVEALLRWNSRQFGAVSPAEFIPLAERSDLIVSLGEWVLRTACRQAVAWRAENLRAPRIAVNLSLRQLAQPDIAARIQGLALELRCDPSWLGLEITESMLMEDSQHAAKVLRELKSIGFEISLDDFGTGYSSLSRLKQMPIDIVKIDKSFVPDVTAATEDVSVTRAIITMAHSLQLRVLAEGVETEGQLGLLVANGCDLVQGYYFSRPVAASAIATMLQEDRRLPEQFVRRSKNCRTLLLVDDEENILSSLKRLFRRDGYQIVCARSAAEGLQRLAEARVDVILSDQRMPGMTGVEFLRRAKELYPHTVRLVLSGFTDLQSIIDAVNEGAIYKFLTKPWDDERIRAHVAEAFSQKEVFDENRRLAREVEGANVSLARLNERLQETLTQQSDRAQVLERSADSAREILDSVPATIIGIDADGLIAFVNGNFGDILPDVGAALGRPADAALPAPLLQILRDLDGPFRRISIGTRSFHALARPLHANGMSHDRLITLFPIEENITEASA